MLKKGEKWENYEAQFEDGLKYQRFVEKTLGILPHENPSLDVVVENPLGLEIKYDKRSLETGNFYFEFMSKDKNGRWRDSGIRLKQPWGYLVGTWEFALLFPLEFWSPLREERMRLEELLKRYGRQVTASEDRGSGKEASSKGLVVPIVTCENLCIRRFEWERQNDT